MLRHTTAGILAALFASAATCGVAVAQDRDDAELVEKAVKMEELPAPVAATLKKELGDNEPTEIEAIVYEGIAVLYEAEYTREGKEVEIVVRPWGELVPPGARQEADDDDDEGEDDDDRAQAAAGQDDGDSISERRLEVADLPKVVGDALRAKLGEGPFSEVEEVSYEGIVILYEAESDKGEVAFFPNGQVAQPLNKDDDDDDDGDEDDDDDKDA